MYSANYSECFKDSIKYLVEDFYLKTGVFVNSIQVHSIDASTVDHSPIESKREITKIRFQAE